MAAPSEPNPKKSCSGVLIGTHNGAFHCDEALACYMLKLLPEYKDARWLIVCFEGKSDEGKSDGKLLGIIL